MSYEIQHEEAGNLESKALQGFITNVNDFLPLALPNMIEINMISQSNDDPRLRTARKALILAALSLGALTLSNDTQLAYTAGVSWANQARSHLCSVFDFPSEITASALLCLSLYYTRVGPLSMADLYLVHAHTLCVHLSEFPLHLELCIEHLSSRSLKVELRPNFLAWPDKRLRLLHIVSHAISALSCPPTNSMPPLTQDLNEGTKMPAALSQAHSPGTRDALTWIARELLSHGSVPSHTTSRRIDRRSKRARNGQLKGLNEADQKNTSGTVKLVQVACAGLAGLLLLATGDREGALVAVGCAADLTNEDASILKIIPFVYEGTCAAIALLAVMGEDELYEEAYSAAQGGIFPDISTPQSGPSEPNQSCSLPAIGGSSPSARSASMRNWIAQPCISPVPCLACTVKSLAVRHPSNRSSTTRLSVMTRSSRANATRTSSSETDGLGEHWQPGEDLGRTQEPGLFYPVNEEFAWLNQPGGTEGALEGVVPILDNPSSLSFEGLGGVLGSQRLDSEGGYVEGNMRSLEGDGGDSSIQLQAVPHNLSPFTMDGMADDLLQDLLLEVFANEGMDGHDLLLENLNAPMDMNQKDNILQLG